MRTENPLFRGQEKDRIWHGAFIWSPHGEQSFTSGTLRPGTPAEGSGAGAARTHCDNGIDRRPCRDRCTEAVSRPGMLIDVHILHRGAASVGTRCIRPNRGSQALSGVSRRAGPTAMRGAHTDEFAIARSLVEQRHGRTTARCRCVQEQT